MKLFDHTGKLSKEYLKEQKKWYRKLRKEGFKDAEDFTQEGEPRELLESTTGRSFSSSADAFRKYDEATQRYFELARQHYWDIEKSRKYTKEQKQMWWQYAHEGDSANKISKAFGRGYSTVRAFIAQEEAIFLPDMAARP